MASSSASNIEPPPKEKKTRRRLRLSCVECTKRRQRCDRNYPCGLCTSRGVSHLCRWESVPVSRPTPARPPDHRGLRTATDSETKIKELSERIVVLERSLEQQNSAAGGSTSDYTDRAHFRTSSAGSAGARSPSAYLSDLSPGGFAQDSPYSSPEPQSQDDDDDTLRVTVTREGYDAAWSLLQEALGDQREFMGHRSSWDLLHSCLKDGSTTSKFVHSSLTDIVSVAVAEDPRQYSYTPSFSVEQLTQRLPPNEIISQVLSTFFAEVNWNFGIPEHWLRSSVMQMWNTLRFPDMAGRGLNASWLSLIFTVLACTPHLDIQLVNPRLESVDQYSVYANAALQIAENASGSPLSGRTKPLFTDGAVLACLAVPLLCSFYTKNGFITESWKLLGTWIRIAQSLGIHCDPDKYGGSGMPQQEKCLRTLAWCNLMTWERFSASILGRPQMVDMEVPGFVSVMLSHPDGASNFFGIYQSALIRLSNIVGEINAKCIAVDRPSPKTVYDLDESLEQWRKRLPFEYRIRNGDSLEFNASSLTSTLNFRQWYTLSTWYLFARIKLHLGYVTGEKENLQYFPPFPPYMSRKQSRVICMDACIEMLRLQCDMVEMLCRVKTESIPTDVVHLHWDVIGPIGVLEAAVGLIALMAWKSPEQSIQAQAEAVLARTIQTLPHVRLQSREGNRLSGAATSILTALLREATNRKGTPLSRAQSPPAPGPSTLPPRNNPELTFSGQSEAWKYDWYSNLSTIAPPTVSMFAPSHPPDRESYGDMPMPNSHSSNLFQLGGS
ncbi:hypothetical protein VNI00_007523 [Paramarasmius palmivorus]|uniref:Zn(2)-C6 fungal-type domain-containing protein n=1 Tax=Paramarasmius palmivorus TaxID=297713 RepID=A0AAW0D2A0_9AGAR